MCAPPEPPLAEVAVLVVDPLPPVGLLVKLLPELLVLLLLLPGRRLPPAGGLPEPPVFAELDAFAVTPVDEDEELLLLLLLDDLLEALLLRCLDDDETPLPLPEIPAPELVLRALLVAPVPLPLLLVILMLVAEVAEEFMVESISFSGDEQESEEVSC